MIEQAPVSPLLIVVIAIGVLIGVPFVVFCFSAIRRLHDLHKEQKQTEGTLFVSSTGEIFSEFNIPIDELQKRDTILIQVIKINIKEDDSHGNVSTETYKT